MKIQNDDLKSYEKKINTVFNHYFNALEADLINNNLNIEGLCAYILCIIEFYDFFKDKEKWINYLHKIFIKTQNNIKKHINNLNTNLIGGLGEYCFVTNLCNSKFGTYSNLLNMLMQYYNYIIKIKFQNNNDELRCNKYDLISGLAGTTVIYSQEEIPNNIEIRDNIADYFSRLTLKTNEKSGILNGWLIYKTNNFGSYNYIDLGMPHGLLGPLFFLSKFNKERKNDRIYNSIIKIMEFYNNNYVPNDYGLMWPAELCKVPDLDIQKDYRESWCYGSLNISYILWLICMKNSLFSESKKYFENILRIASHLNENYNLVSPIICHGYSGILKIFTNIFNITNNPLIFIKIKQLLNVVLGDYSECIKYGFVNKGINETNKLIVAEQFDILNSASGIILVLLSFFKKELVWDKILNLGSEKI